jgi:hypothetical protein
VTRLLGLLLEASFRFFLMLLPIAVLPFIIAAGYAVAIVRLFTERER